MWLRSVTENLVKQQVQALQKDNFQEFIVFLLFIVHTTDGFASTREIKDKGADGLIETTKTVIACWGPQQRPAGQLKKAYETKFKVDYDAYQAHWQQDYPNWCVYTNHEPSPGEIAFVKNLKAGSLIKGVAAISEIIFGEIGVADRRRVLSKLGIPKQYLSSDIVSEIFEDILKIAGNGNSVTYTLAPYVPEKIELNVHADDVDTIQEEFDLAYEQYFQAIWDSLEAFDDNEKKLIKSQMIGDYNSSQGKGFTNKLNAVTTKYLDKYHHADDNEMRTVIRALWYWLFEQCLVGKKTPGEKKRTA